MSDSKRAEHRTVLIVASAGAVPEVGPVLEREGWVVERRQSLVEAVLPVFRGFCDVVLLHEEALPAGGHALQELRQTQPTVPVVLLLVSLPYVEGADECLTLPCAPIRILKALEYAHERQQQKRLLEKAHRENEQLRARAVEQNARVAALENGLAELSEAASDLQVLFRTALRLFGDATGAGRVSLMLLEKNEHEGELRIVESRGLSDDIVANTRLKLGEGVAGWVAQHGRWLLKARHFSPHDQAGEVRSYKADAFLSLPLKLGEEVLGVVNMTEGVETRLLGQPEIRALSVLAEQTAAWIRYCERLQHARKLSLVDELTGLYNRRYFMDALEREIRRADRTGEQLGLAMLDIDHFKAYNDSRGHQAGDRLLKEFARVVQGNVRLTDIVCRYGGEEFAIILPETGKGGDRWRSTGAHFIDRLRAAVSDHRFDGAERQPGGRLTVSAGVAVFPQDASDVENLIAASDQMLYEAKGSGRNRVCSRMLPGDARTKHKTA